MFQLTRRLSLLLLCAACGGARVRDFYTPEERASVIPMEADAGVVQPPSDSGVSATEAGIERLQKPCPTVATPMPLTGASYRCINKTDGFVGYEGVADSTCDDVSAPLRQVLGPRSDTTCQLNRGMPTKVVRITDSTTLFYFRATASTGTLVVE